MMDIINSNRNYWTGRASSYAALNRAELLSDQKEKWQDFLCERIASHFPDRLPGDLAVLDAGTGPGFLAIILADAGYPVTAIDLTPAMLSTAKNNAGELADSIRFMEMNAQELSFADNCFDVIVTRNLTWDLPDPERFYHQLCRVLRPGGILINFDANWYRYLYDENALIGYEEDRENSANARIPDKNIVAGADVMEEIARQVPLSNILRPAWDLKILNRLGMQATADEHIYARLWTDEEKINFHSTPLFVITAIKPTETELS